MSEIKRILSAINRIEEDVSHYSVNVTSQSGRQRTYDFGANKKAAERTKSRLSKRGIVRGLNMKQRQVSDDENKKHVPTKTQQYGLFATKKRRMNVSNRSLLRH